MTMNQLWDDTPATEKGSRTDRAMSDVPDGSYDGRVVDFSCFRADSGDWYISWWIEVDQGLRSGALLQRFLQMNDNTVGFTKADFRTVIDRIPSWDEMAIEDTGQTGPIRHAVLGARVRVRQRSRRVQQTTYKDVYINELLEAPQGVREPEAEEPPDNRGREPEETGEPPAEGWGDPDCPGCFGKGCEDCVGF